jgi:hypothetical protein
MLKGGNMRSEREMLGLILDIARKDERVRAVIMPPGISSKIMILSM